MAGLTITNVLAVPVTGGYFVDDQAAIKAGRRRDGVAYLGAPVTPGFGAVREPAEAVSILLVLSDGHVAHGDCVSVQYSGVGGREPRLRANHLAAAIDERVAPQLRGSAVTAFRPAADTVERFADLGTAAAYGLSQALLDAAARRAGRTMADVIAEEWGLDSNLTRVPLYAQTGEERYSNVDKMVLKQVESLPHGLINHRSLIGADGAELIAYVRWVRDRILHLRRFTSYSPILHFDVYGTLGDVCGGDLDRIAIVLATMAEAAHPFALRVEHPLDAGSRAAQIVQLAALRDRLRDVPIQIVADEWANTVDDIRAFNRARAADVIQIKAPDLGAIHNVVDAIVDCHAHGVIAHLGGSCTETERSAQVSVHLALGAHADQMLAKPGMGVDEGLEVVRNEMERTLALSTALKGGSGRP